MTMSCKKHSQNQRKALNEMGITRNLHLGFPRQKRCTFQRQNKAQADLQK